LSASSQDLRVRSQGLSASSQARTVTLDQLGGFMWEKRPHRKLVLLAQPGGGAVLGAVRGTSTEVASYEAVLRGMERAQLRAKGLGLPAVRDRGSR
jgi:hypothetical protein